MNQRPSPRSLLLLFGIFLVLLSGCGKADSSSATATLHPVSQSYFIFDTIVQVKVYDELMTEAHFAEIKTLLDDIDSKMNRNNKDSEIAAINAAAGKQAVQVSPETFEVVSKAYTYTTASNGSFNVAIGPLVSLWNIGNEGAQVPSDKELAATKELIHYTDVQLDEQNQTIYLAKEGMSLDLGSIAKGYAADVIVDYLQKNNFQSAIIDLGGNVFAMGKKPGNKLWTVGIQDPDQQRGNPIGNIHVDNQTIVTSGVYERFFEENGKHYHHILDSTTGYPIDNGLSSVTILTDHSIDADALSTTVFALGIEEGMKFIEGMDNTEALFITQDRQVYASSGMEQLLEMTNDSYTLISNSK